MSKREHPSDSPEGIGCFPVKHSKSTDGVGKEETQPLENDSDEIHSVASLEHLLSTGCSTSTASSPVQLHHLQLSSNSQRSQSQQRSRGIVNDCSPSEGVFLREPSLASELIGDDFFEHTSATQESSTHSLDELQQILDSVIKSDELLTQAVTTILDNETIYSKIIEKLSERTKSSMRKGLKNSKLIDKYKNRDYLLDINPLDLCVEFQQHQQGTFNVVCQVLLGLNNIGSVFESQYLLNSVCTIYSIIARIHNRLAIGYSLLLGVAARDGGLREESLKIIPHLPHVRTIQRYDKILAKDFRIKLRTQLEEESNYFNELKQAEIRLETLSLSDNSEFLRAQESLDEIKNKYPKLLSTVWDNLNVRASSRYERADDKWSDLNYDFMTSLHILDRIDANHLDDTNRYVKKPEELKIDDFCPSKSELEFLLCSMVPMFTHTLVKRFPILYASLKDAIVDHIPHQYQAEMNIKSQEFTGEIYEKSECKTDELIDMIVEYQKQMTHVDDETGGAFARRQLSGDQKTEKNTTYAILSKADELLPADRLAFILPVHEYFHMTMTMADISSRLFRDNARGLEGGAFSTAILLNRKKANVAKGKDNISALSDFYVIKAQGRFCQYFLEKYNLNPDVDNTPDYLKTKTNKEKAAYLNNLTKDALQDLLSLFEDCTGVMPDMTDFPMQHIYEKQRQVFEQMESGADSLVLNNESQAVVNASTFNVLDYLIEDVEVLQSSKSRKVFECSLCNFQNHLKSVVKCHIKKCWTKLSQCSMNNEHIEENDSSQETAADEDFYWNYKNGEFLMDSLFMLTLNFERYGNGTGMYIISKILLPVMHGLGHSNYSNSIHRFICRVLCCTTPREGVKLIHERFSNKYGGKGGNVFKDRRIEFRIRIVKKLLRNLKHHMNSKCIQQVNAVIDIKEELFLHTRRAHGVTVRRGKHKARSDDRDFAMLLKNLQQTEAHVVKSGRCFGSLKYPKNILDDADLFNKASFFRWVTQKNKDFATSFRGSHAEKGFPGS